MRRALSVAASLLGVILAGCGADAEAGGQPDGAVSLDAADATDEGPTVIFADPAGPPYPLVLVHGMGGFRNIGPIDYFYGVADALRKDGHDVFVSQQDPINDSDVRGPQVLDYVRTVFAMTGKRKVNLVGHSQGGFDARFVASTIGDRVGAVVTIGSPMRGDPIADLVVKNAPQAEAAVNVLLDLYGAANGYDSNAQAQIAMLSSDGAAAFFARHPDDDRVAYYSIAGRSESARGDPDCLGPRIAPFVSRWDAALDPLDPLLGAAAAILDGLTPKPIHDGLVPVSSARHGTFLGCIPADHLDEINQIAGDSPGVGNPFDAIAFYRDLAAFLVAEGY
jgi:triacylglycerol lipase